MGITLLKSIRHKLAFVLMLMLLASCVAITVDAKFWQQNHKHKHGSDQSAQDTTAQATDKPLSKKQQKKLKREQKKKEKQEQKAEHKKQKQEQKNEHKKQKQDRRKNRKNKATVEAGSVTVMKVVRPEDEYPLTKMKDRYRVDVLAALYLDELVKGESVTFKNKVPEKAAQGLAFYEGILIAADSLKKAGFDIDIYIHDIASAAETPQMLVAEDKLDSTDLILGAVQPRDLPMLAAYARKKQVNFVSTLSPADGGVINNPYLTLMQPSFRSHCDWIAGNVATKFPGMNVAVLYRTSVPTDELAYKCMTQGNSYSIHYREVSCNSLPGKQKLASLLDTTKPNVVIIPISDVAYADSILAALSQYFPSTHFEVYGMPTWSTMQDLHKENAFPNLSVNVTIPFHADLSCASGKYVTGIYKKEYGAKVPDMAYKGYETMFWYANLLKKYGTIFNVKYEDNTTAPFTSFEMMPRLDKMGNIMFYENRHLFVSRYEGGVNKTE